MSATSRSALLRNKQTSGLFGEINIPADKSITHRALILAAVSKTPSKIYNPSWCDDSLATLNCLGQLGLEHSEPNHDYLVIKPIKKWKQPQQPLECKDSATTMRLLAGLLASQPGLQIILYGSEGLKKRPMSRIIEPLTLMGAQLNGRYAPIRIVGSQLQGTKYLCPIASGQIKSCVLLAGLFAEGKTYYSEPVPSRDHTERLLKHLGVCLTESDDRFGHHLEIEPGHSWDGFEITVPGDLSSAAYWMVGAACLPKSQIKLNQVGVNPTRAGILKIFDQCGVQYEISNQHTSFGEPVADITVNYSNNLLKPFQIDQEILPRLIDEVPILAVLATQCQGTSYFHDLSELRYKESDRIQKTYDSLVAMGANVEISHHNLIVHGPTVLNGAKIDSGQDHRMAMTFFIAGLIAQGETKIYEVDCIRKSYPNFQTDFERLQVE